MTVASPTAAAFKSAEQAVLHRAVHEAREAQRAWETQSVRLRSQVIGRVSGVIAARAEEFCRQVTIPQRRSRAETLSAELIPLAAAGCWLQKHARSLLSPRSPSHGRTPLWRWGSRAKIARRPHGVVLVVGPFNFPLLLSGVPTAQALVAGNAVILKPAPGTEAAIASLVTAFYDAGVPRPLLHCITGGGEVARLAIECGVDLIVLTGSSQTGRAVLRGAAEHLTPAIVELSGCDGMFVLPGADRRLVADAVRFGLQLNSGATCIAPRRMLVEASMLPAITDDLKQVVEGLTIPLAVHPPAVESLIEKVEDALRRGARILPDGGWCSEELRETRRMRPIVLLGCQPDWPIAAADLFAPVLSVIACVDPPAMLTADRCCPYALGASVFGPRKIAADFADRLPAGSVTINDLIAPTADPRLPFGGCRESGFGSTRGAEGLLAMTRPQVVVQHRFGPRFHLQPADPSDGEFLDGVLRVQYGSRWRDRWRGLTSLIRAARKRGGADR
jgi:aldehyde dehydrogenase (NAD+)